MKILRVVDVPKGPLGGVALATEESSRALRSRGHDVQVWYSDDVAPSFIRGKARRLLAPWWVAYRFWRSNGRYDVVELHEPLAWIVALFSRNTPVAVISHGLEVRAFKTLATTGIEQPSRLRLLWLNLSIFWPQRLSYRVADIVFVLNNRDADFLAALAPRATIHVYKNGVAGEPSPSLKSTQEYRPRILFLGNLTPRKGREAVVQAAAALVDEGITVAGDPGADPELKGIRWHGSFARTEHKRILGEHDILLLPSYFEGMPLGLLEAMRAGLAIVATDIGGVTDVLGPRGAEPSAGLLCQPGDVNTLIEHLRSLLAAPELLAELRRRALLRVEDYSWDAAAATLEQGYERARKSTAGS